MMFGKLNHLAITTDHYTTLGMFYRAVFGMKVSGDTSREMSAISVGDGYVGMTLIPRRGGRKACCCTNPRCLGTTPSWAP